MFGKLGSVMGLAALVVVAQGVGLGHGVTAAAGGPPLTCRGMPATVVGTPGKDDVKAGDLQPGDVVQLRGSKDDAVVAVSDVVICGGPGRDQLYAEEGATGSLLDGGTGVDILTALEGQGLKYYGGGGADLVESGDGPDTIRMGDGDDQVEANGGEDTVFGGPGRDQIKGGSDDDELHGGGDKDRLHGGHGRDTGFGGGGIDRCATEKRRSCEHDPNYDAEL